MIPSKPHLVCNHDNIHVVLDWSVVYPDPAREFWERFDEAAANAPILVSACMVDEIIGQPFRPRQRILLDCGVHVIRPIDAPGRFDKF